MLQTLSFGFCAGVPLARSAWEVRIPSLATLDRTSLAFTTSTASNFLHIPLKMQTHRVWTRGTKNLDLITSLFDLFGNSEKVPYYITALPTSVFRIFPFFPIKAIYQIVLNCSPQVAAWKTHGKTYVGALAILSAFIKLCFRVATTGAILDFVSWILDFALFPRFLYQCSKTTTEFKPNI